MRRIPIALIFILAGLLAACTNPSSGRGGTGAPVPVASEAAPAPSTVAPGY